MRFVSKIYPRCPRILLSMTFGGGVKNWISTFLLTFGRKPTCTGNIGEAVEDLESGRGGGSGGNGAYTTGVRPGEGVIGSDVRDEGGGGSIGRNGLNVGMGQCISPRTASPLEPSSCRQVCPMLELMPPMLMPPIICPNPTCGLVMSRDGVEEPLNFCPLCGAKLLPLSTWDHSWTREPSPLPLPTVWCEDFYGVTRGGS